MGSVAGNILSVEKDHNKMPRKKNVNDEKKADRVLYARKGGEDVAATAANLGGDKITVEEAIKLKDFCWGGPNIVPRAEWIKSGLVFHIPEQTNAYGLNATKGAVKAFQIVIESF